MRRKRVEVRSEPKVEIGVVFPLTSTPTRETSLGQQTLQGESSDSALLICMRKCAEILLRSSRLRVSGRKEQDAELSPLSPPSPSPPLHCRHVRPAHPEICGQLTPEPVVKVRLRGSVKNRPRRSRLQHRPELTPASQPPSPPHKQVLLTRRRVLFLCSTH